MSLPGPTLTRWNRPAEPCRGCPGCSIRDQLDARDTFTRGEVAHLLALAFRSGAQLAHDMAEDVHYWAQQPIVRRTAERKKQIRLAEMAVSTERMRERDRIAAAKLPQVRKGQRTGVDAYGRIEPVGGYVDPDVEWPEVATPGATGGE